MTKHNHSPRWWLLLTRGAVYVLVGIAMFVSANSYSQQLGHIVSALVILAGICQLLFSFTNRGPENNNIWGILHGVTDLAFGVAMYIYSKDTIMGFGDMLGFWAMIYACLQVVQAMYASMDARGTSGVHLSTMIVHFANVLIAGGMSYVLLLSNDNSTSSFGLIGLFPALLGVLILILAQQMRAQATSRQHDSPNGVI